MSPNRSCQREKNIVHFQLHSKTILPFAPRYVALNKYTGVMLSGSEGSGRFTRVKKIKFFGFASQNDTGEIGFSLGMTMDNFMSNPSNDLS